jgi:uncharacterized protein YkuJ
MKTSVHPFAKKISEESVVLNKAFPLVRELAHKYGLSVIAMKEFTDTKLNYLYMAREDGIPVCKVFFMPDKESFAIRNCMNNKERGRSYEDKLTFFGKKVSFVMKTIEKENLIPTSTLQFITSVFGDPIKYGIDSFSDAYGEIRKTGQLTGETVHQLIEIALGNRHVSTLSVESMSKVQSALDKYREADKTREERKRELANVFSNPLWAILYDKTDSFCVGRLSLIPKWSDDTLTAASQLDVAIVEPFRRVADITEIPELIPTMTMLKVAIEQNPYANTKTFVGESGFFPHGYEAVNTELQVIGIRSGSRWERRALLDPKLLLVAA